MTTFFKNLTETLVGGIIGGFVMTVGALLLAAFLLAAPFFMVYVILPMFY